MRVTQQAERRVAIINRQLSRVLGLENPVGSRVRFGRDNNTFEVVGVAGDALFLFLKEERRPMCVLPVSPGVRCCEGSGAA